MRPCESIAGLPVIPRFGLSNHCHNDILVAALLDQPIVPMTHHQAVADGYALLDEAASFINSMGRVVWRDLKTISRSMYSRKDDNGRLRVKMLSKRSASPFRPAPRRFKSRARAVRRPANRCYGGERERSTTGNRCQTCRAR